MFGKILGALSWQQVVMWVVGTGGIYVIQHFVPPGDLQSTLLTLDANLVSILTILFRKPSTSGGTVTEAVQISPAPAGTPLVAEAPKHA